MSYAIQVENLSKKYRLSHLPKEHYTALRDVITNSVKRLVSASERARPLPSEEDFWALRELSFKVGVGERVGIIGRNGAGKSTLLKLLSRITAPSTGKITLRGRVASLLEVGTGFHPELTGRENVFINGSILGMTRREIQRKFDEIVAFSDVERFLDTPVKRYSSGMYMRLAFAVAAHLEPEILMVDEVLAVGDAQFQAKCLGKMDSISREGRTVLFVSHNMSAVATLCDRAIMLQSGGRPAIDGSVDEVVAHYLGSTPQSEDLAGRKDRTGSGVARAISLSLRDASGATVHALSTHEPVDIVLDVEADAEAVGKSVAVAFVILDRSETRLFSLYTLWHQMDLKLSSRRQRFTCRVTDGIPLMPDHYSILVSVAINGIAADKISNATQFELVSKDLFGTGALPSLGLGPMVVRHSWQVTGRDD
jgi:lipopolysaccharide transport system ATP-binding protein